MKYCVNETLILSGLSRYEIIYIWKKYVVGIFLYSLAKKFLKYFFFFIVRIDGNCKNVPIW